MTTALVGTQSRTDAHNTPRSRPLKAEDSPPALRPKQGERWTVGLYLAEVKGQVFYFEGGPWSEPQMILTA